MRDLTKNTTPFGLMIKEEQDEMRRLMEQGVEFEFYSTKGIWVKTPSDFFTCNTYRPVIPAHTKPSPPWEYLADWVNWVARDENTRFWAYEIEPLDGESTWDFNEGWCEPLAALKFDPGTCHWRDSLVKRPEGQGDE